MDEEEEEEEEEVKEEQEVKEEKEEEQEVKEEKEEEVEQVEEVRRGGQTAERFGISPKQKLWAKKRNSCAALRGQAAPKISHGSKRAGRRPKKAGPSGSARATASARARLRAVLHARGFAWERMRARARLCVRVCA